ncbi:MAG: sterol desaturase family protein [Parachlamydiaceae bacterium]|nr:sterol desaturase family protein [Parachlamydiaceae bacterium]
MDEKIEGIFNNWVQLRVVIFMGIFLILALGELVFPKRVKAQVSQKTRWISNIGIVLLDNFLMRLILPIMAIDMAIFAQKMNWGIFNLIEIPFWLNLILTIVILDFIIYLQHVMFHTFPLFWRVHRMHHADVDFDVTTGIRFHPIEVIISMGIKIGSVALLGASPIGVLVFEIILNATSMFSHSNLRLPLAFDRVLRCVIVTPDMHRVHHSIHKNETNSNFGFNFSFWDRIFGTYINQPSEGHFKMTIGISDFRQPKYLRFDWLLLIPFIGKISHETLNKKRGKDD